MDTTSPTVAVIDIGSNSIKLLVAAGAKDGTLHELLRTTEETRIGTGITGNPPTLREDAMQKAIEAIKRLLCRAAPYSPVQVVAVATSAVRDARNGADFAAMLFDATTIELRILAGLEEAHLIGRGIACEPALKDVEAFYLFDLGGGSLEMLSFEERILRNAASLQLGCVRVTEHCVPSPDEPLSDEVIDSVRRHVRDVVSAGGFKFDLPSGSEAIATGGTATTFRAMAAAATGVSFENTSPVLALDALEETARRVSKMSIAERRTIPGLPAARADVFPAALLTLCELAHLARIDCYRNSLYNLRYGLASELLEENA